MTPIVYKAAVPVRFSDLDPYGHVNSTHYLDYIISSRFAYARERFGVTDKTFTEKKIGFYLTKAEMSFKRPILGVAGVVVAQSFVKDVADVRLIVPYELRSADESTVHSAGTLEFCIVELTHGRPTPMTDWVRQLFFEEGTTERTLLREMPHATPHPGAT
jgi:YbgC/YbaW family acyl-CoA thioester hydrolase